LIYVSNLVSDNLDDEQLTKKFQNSLRGIVDAEGIPEEPIVSNLLERHIGRVQRRKYIFGREFILNAHIDDYNISNVMIDLGSDINILPKKTWEAIGKPKLIYSPIQFCMDNQYCIYIFERLKNIEVDLDGVKTILEFKFIEIMGEKDSYPTLLGIDLAYENYDFMDLKKETMNFPVDGVKVIQPLDPYQGPRYTDSLDDNIEQNVLDQLCTMTIGKQSDYINPTMDG